MKTTSLEAMSVRFRKYAELKNLSTLEEVEKALKSEVNIIEFKLPFPLKGNWRFNKEKLLKELNKEKEY